MEAILGDVRDDGGDAEGDGQICKRMDWGMEDHTEDASRDVRDDGGNAEMDWGMEDHTGGC